MKFSDQHQISVIITGRMAPTVHCPKKILEIFFNILHDDLISFYFTRLGLQKDPKINNGPVRVAEPELAGAGAGAGILKFRLRLPAPAPAPGQTKVVYLIIIHIE